MVRSRLIIALLGLCAIPVAAATLPEQPPLKDPLPFEHSEHARVFEHSRIACVDCHPVGLRVETEADPTAPVAELEPSIEICHGCHRGKLLHAPGGAPSRCTTCHADGLALKPDTHDENWLDTHGPEARAFGSSCDDCHKKTECIDCHDDRGPMARSPHGPGFATFHGVEARNDPRSCTTCHAGTTCTTCHSTGSSPW